MKMTGPIGLILASLLLLVACKGDDGSTNLSGGGNFVADGFCEVDGLTVPVRHTFLLVDQTALSHTETAAEFIGANAWVRDAVLAVADPVLAIGSGVSEPRERITIIRLPGEGAGGARVFTGCIPAMSEEEIAAARTEGSRVGDFFSGGVRSDLEQQAERFRTQLTAALQAIARETEGAARAQRGNPAEAALFRSLRSSEGLLQPGSQVPRLILITDFSRTRLPRGGEATQLRRSGLRAGLETGLNFGGSEVAIVQPGPAPANLRAFLDAFLIAQRGRLVYLGDPNIGSLPMPPRSVRRYVGEVSYPDGPQSAQIRIGIDRNGKLASSWIILRDLTDRALPLDGQANCDGEDICVIRSTDDGLGQTWSPSPGGQPEFDDAAPLGGMRNFEFRTEAEDLTGRIFDPLVDQIGPDPSNDSLAVRANLRRNANF